MLRIRLARRGRRGRPSYRIVVTPSDASRDGRSVSDLGYYNALSEPSEFQIDLEEARDWISKGAQPSTRVWKILELAQPGFKDSLATGDPVRSGSPDVSVSDVSEEKSSPATAKSSGKARPASKGSAKVGRPKAGAKGRTKAAKAKSGARKATPRKSASKAKSKSRAT